MADREHLSSVPWGLREEIQDPSNQNVQCVLPMAPLRPLTPHLQRRAFYAASLPIRPRNHELHLFDI
jgi:hypothetical protein